MKRSPIFGLMAEFDSATDLLHAARRAYAEGYRRLDAYSPFPIEEVSEAIGYARSRMPLVVLVGGLLGGIGGYLMQYWIAVLNYPLNIAGRPLNSWPSFIVVTFEMTILGGALFAVFGMLALNRLPMPYHPVFNVERFAFASKDRFFLCIYADDRRFDRAQTEKFLQGLNPKNVAEVPH
jgi:hypothetical protein